jgi:hypothetical protein
MLGYILVFFFVSLFGRLYCLELIGLDIGYNMRLLGVHGILL